MSSTASLYYGLRVPVGDLVAAARAHQRVTGPQRALKLIQLRRTSSQLTIQAGADCDAVTRVPCEMWSLIAQAVIDVELAGSRTELSDSLSCGCRPMWSSHASEWSGKAAEWPRLWEERVW